MAQTDANNRVPLAADIPSGIPMLQYLHGMLQGDRTWLRARAVSLMSVTLRVTCSADAPRASMTATS